MARPKKEIDWDIVQKLMEAKASANEIAGKFHIQNDTFYKRFKEEFGFSYQDYHINAEGAGLADLKLMQHAKALNNKAPGNSNMLIWLGKVRLGQKEPDVSSLNPINQPDIDKDHRIMQLEHEIAQLKVQNSCSK